MDWSSLSWLFAVAVLVHNLEEAVWLPRWSRRAGRWQVPVGPGVFRFAAAVLTVMAFLAAWLSARGGAGSLGAYLLAGYALAMALNAIVPHGIATIALHRYAPGTATAVLFNLPLGVVIVYRALADGYVEPARFWIAGPATVIAIAASVPLLFAVGRVGARRCRNHQIDGHSC